MTETTTAGPATLSPPAEPPEDTGSRGVPEGFFAEIAASLETESAADISDAVIAVCTARGILHPDLEEDPDTEIRAEELREVFALLDAATAAVADGTIVPRRVHVDDDYDSDMAAAWESFADDAVDLEAEESVAKMMSTGTPEAPE